MAKGRPSKFTPKLVDEILLLISEGHSERSIFDNNPNLPAWRNWFAYKSRNKDPEFHQRYAYAREAKYTAWEHKILERALDDSRDTLENEVSYVKKNGEVITKTERRSDNTAVNRDRLVVDSMKWIMSKLMPNTYGDKLTTEHTGANGGPIQYSQLVDKPKTETVEQWQARVAKQIAAKPIVSTDKDTVH